MISLVTSARLHTILRHCVCSLILLVILCGPTRANKPPKPKAIHSDIIEDVDANRLFELVESEEFLAVFFCEYGPTLEV